MAGNRDRRKKHHLYLQLRISYRRVAIVNITSGDLESFQGTPTTSYGWCAMVFAVVSQTLEIPAEEIFCCYRFLLFDSAAADNNICNIGDARTSFFVSVIGSSDKLRFR